MRFETKAGATVQKPNRLHFPTSIDTLSPNNRFVLALNTLPIANQFLIIPLLETAVAEIPRTAATELWLTGALIWRERNRNESYRRTTALTKTGTG
jgi:hypothetical protein